jgi:hypothetical protein
LGYYTTSVCHSISPIAIHARNTKTPKVKAVKKVHETYGNPRAREIRRDLLWV